MTGDVYVSGPEGGSRRSSGRQKREGCCCFSLLTGGLWRELGTLSPGKCSLLLLWLRRRTRCRRSGMQSRSLTDFLHDLFTGPDLCSLTG